jgi:hypothetical protein
VGASHLTKHESDASNSAKCLQKHDKNPFFTISADDYIIDAIELFPSALARLRVVNTDSGRVTPATNPMSPSLARCERLIAPNSNTLFHTTGGNGEQAWR